MEEKKTIGSAEGELTEEELNRVTGGESGGVTEITMFVVNRDMVCDKFYTERLPSSDDIFATNVSVEKRCCGVCHHFLCPQGQSEGVCAMCDTASYRRRGQWSPIRR